MHNQTNQPAHPLLRGLVHLFFFHVMALSPETIRMTLHRTHGKNSAYPVPLSELQAFVIGAVQATVPKICYRLTSDDSVYRVPASLFVNTEAKSSWQEQFSNKLSKAHWSMSFTILCLLRPCTSLSQD